MKLKTIEALRERERERESNTSRGRINVICYKNYVKGINIFNKLDNINKIMRKVIYINTTHNLILFRGIMNDKK